MRYLRCPYAFYLLDQGLIEFEGTLTRHQARLVEEGVEFQAGIEAETLPLDLKPSELRTVFAEESIRLFGVPVLKNHQLRLTGQPDAVDTAKGALIPLEIKSHKSVQRSDELELAFYWMLLAPYRTKKAPPVGRLLLRRNGLAEEVEVEIGPSRFEQVRQLLQEVRDARRSGVRPRICGCNVCSGVKQIEVLRITRKNKDLSLIWGIGSSRAACLEAIGIKTYHQLTKVESVTIVESLRELGRSVSLAQVDRWKHHATSYKASRPVVFGEVPVLEDGFIALDLEYGPEALIWLIGICLAQPARHEYFSLWADARGQEKDNIRRLIKLVAAHPLLPVVTWSGSAADLSQLRSAAQRLKVGDPIDLIQERHLDLFQCTSNAIRFPVPGLDLGSVAAYLGIPRLSSLSDGLEAQDVFLEYQQCQQPAKREKLKSRLVEYNRDDLAALVGVAEHLPQLPFLDLRPELLERPIRTPAVKSVQPVRWHDHKSRPATVTTSRGMQGRSRK